MTTLTAATPDAQRTLCKALFRAREYLGLNQSDLARAIGLDRSTITRLKHKGVLNPDSKPGELATYVIRIFRSLFALMGDDEAAIRHWMTTYNRHLNGQPDELIQNTQGLVQVMGYLDAMRGRV